MKIIVTLVALHLPCMSVWDMFACCRRHCSKTHVYLSLACLMWHLQALTALKRACMEGWAAECHCWCQGTP